MKVRVDRRWPVRVGHTVGRSKRWRVVRAYDQCVRLTDRGPMISYTIIIIFRGDVNAVHQCCKLSAVHIISRFSYLACVCVCVRAQCVHIRYLCVCYSPSFKKYTSCSRVVRISINIIIIINHCVSSRAMTP